MKKYEFIPILLGAILSAVLLLYGIKYEGPSFYFSLFQHDISLAIAQILATIFAITISLTILGFQYLSEGSTPRIISSYIKKGFIILIILLYSISIGGIFLLVHFHFLISILTDLISISALILCLSALVSYLFYLANILQPSEIINEIIKKIPDDFYNKKLKGKKTHEILDGEIDTNIVEIEQILIKAVRGNDYYSFVSGLESMTQKIISIITNANKDPEFQKEDSLNLPYFFLAFYKRIYHEIKKEENDILLYKYIRNIYDNIDTAYSIKSESIKEAYFNHFKEIGTLIIEQNYYSTFSNYFNLMDQIIMKEYYSMSRIFIIPTVVEYIDFISTIANDALKEQKKVVELSKDILSKLLIKTLEDESKGQSNEESKDSGLLGDSYSMQIIKSILSDIEKIHIESCDKKIDIGLFSSYSYPQVIKSLKNQEITELHSNEITNCFCRSFLYSTRSGLSSGINDISNIGIKFFVENLELTQDIVPWLFKCLEVTKEKSKGEYICILEGVIHDIWWNLNENRKFHKNITKDEYQLMTEINIFVEKENKKFKIELSP